MDPTTMIVTAIVNGIVGGFARSMTRDLYQKIKSLLISYDSSLKRSIEAVEEDPESAARRAVLEEDLRKVGADKNEEVLALTHKLLSVLETAGANGHADTNNGFAKSDSLIEATERNAGNRAIHRVVEKHIQSVMAARHHYPLGNLDLLSVNIVTISAHNLPDQVKEDIGRLQEKIRIIIEEVAQRIEERKYKTAKEAIEKMGFAYTDRIKAIELVKADKKIQVSYQTLKTTIEYFSNLNQTIIQKLRKSPSVELETNLVLGNAILIYEVTDFLINYIENFEINGLDDIFRLHKDTKSKVQELRRKESQLREQVKSEKVEAAIREQTLKDIETRERSIKTLEKEWEEYTTEMELFRGEVDVIHAKLPSLEAIRENAKRQLELISVVAILQVIKQNINAIQGAILTLEKIKLVSLNPTRIRRLLGVK